jgi:hypothetical protein
MGTAFSAKSTAVTTGTNVLGTTGVTHTLLTVAAGDTAATFEVQFGSTVSSVVAVWDSGGTNQNCGAALVTLTQPTSLFQSFIFGLVNPTAGAKTLKITWNAVNSDVVVSGTSWKGSDTTGGATTFNHTATASGASTGASVTCTTSTSDAVFAAHGADANFSAISSGIAGFGSTGFDNTLIPTAANYEVGGATAVMTATLASGNWGSIAVNIKGASASAVDGPPHFRPRAFPPQWNLDRQLLLHRRAGPEFSLTPETNTHFVPRAFPRQWNVDRSLFNRRPGPEFSLTPETNPHWQGRAWKPQWNVNDSPNTLWNLAGDVPSIVVAGPQPSFIGRIWRPQWNVDDSPNLLWNSAGDVPSVAAADTPPGFIPKSWLLAWNLNRTLGQGTAQDFTSPAVETNPHWRGLQWPVQWALTRALVRDPAMDVPPPPAQDTPTYFVPLQWQSQWNVDVSLVQAGAQDGSSSDVETNTHWIGKPWAAQWCIQLSLRQAPATDAPVFITAVETNIHFLPRSWPGQWWAKVRQNPATDVPPVVDTPSYFKPRRLLSQWSLNQFLWQNASIDTPVPQTDTPTYFQPRTYPVQWNVTLSLRQNSTPYLNAFPAGTGLFVLTGIDAGLLAPSLLPLIPPFLRWNLERAGWPHKRRRKPTLLEILADIIEAEPPPKVAKKQTGRQKARAAAAAQRWAEEIVTRAQREARSYELDYAKATIDAALREHAASLIEAANQRRLDQEEEEAILLLLSHYH